MTRPSPRVLAAAVVAALLSSPALAQLAPVSEDEGASGLGLALRHLGRSGRAHLIWPTSQSPVP